MIVNLTDRYEHFCLSIEKTFQCLRGCTVSVFLRAKRVQKNVSYRGSKHSTDPKGGTLVYVIQSDIEHVFSKAIISITYRIGL